MSAEGGAEEEEGCCSMARGAEEAEEAFGLLSDGQESMEA